MPAQVLAEVEYRRYRDQIWFFGALSLGGGIWGTSHLMQHPHHPLAYGALLLSLIFAAVFTVWPLIHVYRLRRNLREVTETIQGYVDSDGVCLTDDQTTDCDLPEQEIIPWSSLSLALLTQNHTVLFRLLPDNSSQLLILTSEMFKNSADWRLFQRQLQTAYQQAQGPKFTIRRQVLSGILRAIIFIVVFAIAIAVALSLRKR
jgi:hypothetical protein